MLARGFVLWLKLEKGFVSGLHMILLVFYFMSLSVLDMFVF
jgi:hypothetical protein